MEISILCLGLSNRQLKNLCIWRKYENCLIYSLQDVDMKLVIQIFLRGRAALEAEVISLVELNLN